jgi:hypothetical protein
MNSTHLGTKNVADVLKVRGDWAAPSGAKKPQSATATMATLNIADCAGLVVRRKSGVRAGII